METTVTRDNALARTQGTSSGQNIGGYSDSDELGAFQAKTRPLSPEIALTVSGSGNGSQREEDEEAAREGDGGVHYKLYKRRFFGLVQLALLNIIISWDWLTFSSASITSGQYFGVSQTSINWLSTCIFFAFAVASPPTMWVLNKGGPRPAVLIASLFALLGNWIRYAGTRARADGEQGGVFGLVVFGQILIGFAQPFVLAAPTRYSDMWFSEKGRVTATALPSLANPFGGAIGQLVGPYIATSPSRIPNLVLYVAIIATVVCIPAIFFPAAPPKPPCASSVTHRNTPLSAQLLVTRLFSNLSFYLIAIPFILFVACFNATSSLINQILYPFSYTETQAGIAGAVLILAGLASAIVTSPILDRHKNLSLPFLVIFVTVMASMYIAFIFAPWTRTVAAPYTILGILGATSFSLLPFSLELMVDISYPVSPEVSSCIGWALGNLAGGLLLITMTALRDGPDIEDGPGAFHPGNSPPGNLNRALIYQACFAVIAVPSAMYLRFKRHKDIVFRSEMAAANGAMPIDYAAEHAVVDRRRGGRAAAAMENAEEDRERSNGLTALRD